MPSSKLLNNDVTIDGPIPIAFHSNQRSYFTMKSTSNNNSLGTIIALHPYGGSPLNYLPTLTTFANMGFNLVAPTGVEYSWNAGECCGEARDNDEPDADFIGEVVKSYFFHGGDNNMNKNNNKKAFVLGWSNGGFLATRLAMRKMNGDVNFNWIQGIVAISGEILNPNEYIIKDIQQQIPVPILIIHGKLDTFVRFDGCCPKLHQHCCCNIISSNDCLGTMSVFSRFLTLNGCNNTLDENQQLNTDPYHRVIIIGNKCTVPTMLTILPFEQHHITDSIVFSEAYTFFCSIPGNAIQCDSSTFKPIQFMLSDVSLPDNTLTPTTFTSTAAAVLDDGNGEISLVVVNDTTNTTTTYVTSFIFGCMVFFILSWFCFRPLYYYCLQRNPNHPFMMLFGGSGYRRITTFSA
jgi:predicted esterase